MAKRVEMLGKVFGSWKVLELDTEHPKTKKGILYYKSLCVECARIFSVRGALMRIGGSKRCLECGCGHSHAPQIGQVRTKRTPEQTAHRYLYMHLRKDAKKRKLDWALSESDVQKLIMGNCTYCGAEPSNACSPLKHHGLSQKNTDEATIIRNGIDRVDSSKGYTPDNVVSCCTDCNKAKMQRSSRSFLIWAQKLAKHQGWLK